MAAIKHEVMSQLARRHPFGDQIHFQVLEYLNHLAGKITTILLELQDSELLDIIKDRVVFLANVEEVVSILQNYRQKEDPSYDNENLKKAYFSALIRDVKPRFLDMVTKMSLREENIPVKFADVYGVDLSDDDEESDGDSSINGHTGEVINGNVHGGGKIMLQNLDREINEKELAYVFKSFGNILSCQIAVDEKQQSKGFGFIHYESRQAAEEAILKNGLLLNDKKVNISWFNEEENEKKIVSKPHKENGHTKRSNTKRGKGKNLSSTRKTSIDDGHTSETINRHTSDVSNQHTDTDEVINKETGSGEVGHTDSGGEGILPNPMSYIKSFPSRVIPSCPPVTQMTRPRWQSQPIHQIQNGNPLIKGKRSMENNRQILIPQGPLQYSIRPNFNVSQFLIDGKTPMNSSILDNCPQSEHKQVIGEHLFPLVQKQQPTIAKKITGMLLELDNSELLDMLNNPDLLSAKVEEAAQVFKAYQAKVAQDRAKSTTIETSNEQISDRLFPLVKEQQPKFAGKITGMLLELGSFELLHMLENRELLAAKVEEAAQVIKGYRAKKAMAQTTSQKKPKEAKK